MAKPSDPDLSALGVEDDEDLAALGVESDEAQPVPDETSFAPESYGPTENPVADPGAWQSIVHNFGAGALKQGSDEATGAIVQQLAPRGIGIPSNPGDVYRKARDGERETLAAAREHHPYLSMLANLSGDVASDYLASRAGIPVGNSAYQTGVGALSSLLGDNTDLTNNPSPEDVIGVLERTGTGAAMGYVAPKIAAAGARVVAPVLRDAGRYLGDAFAGSALEDWLTLTARERALKASGYIQKDFPKGDPRALARLQENGQRLLDEPGVIGPFSSKADIANNLEPAVDKYGRQIGAALDEADAASGAAVDLAGTGGYNPYSFAEQAQREVATPAVRNPSLTGEGAGVERWLTRLRQTANEQAAEGQPFTFRQANEYKGDLQNTVFNANGTPKANKAVANDLQRVMTRDIDSQAAPLLGPDGVANFQEARRNYGAMADALEKAQQGANRDVGNNALGLKDWDAAQAAAQAGAGWLSPAVAVVSKLVRGRADSLAARTFDAAASGGADWLDTLARTNPEALGKYGALLGAAASRSPEALGQTHNQLAETDDEYQRRMRALGGQRQ